MTRLFATTLCGLLALAAETPAPTHQPASVQGVWKTVEIAFPGPNGRTLSDLQANLSVFAATHYSRTVLETDRQRPMLSDPAKATADELRAVWGPFSGEAGTYEISDALLTMRPIVAKNPAAMVQGAFTTYALRVVADTMWLTAQKTDRGPVPGAPTVKAVRIE
jgi:hypothetical protein